MKLINTIIMCKNSHTMKSLIILFICVVCVWYMYLMCVWCSLMWYVMHMCGVCGVCGVLCMCGVWCGSGKHLHAQVLYPHQSISNQSVNSYTVYLYSISTVLLQYIQVYLLIYIHALIYI